MQTALLIAAVLLVIILIAFALTGDEDKVTTERFAYEGASEPTYREQRARHMASLRAGPARAAGARAPAARALQRNQREQPRNQREPQREPREQPRNYREPLRIQREPQREPLREPRAQPREQPREPREQPREQPRNQRAVARAPHTQLHIHAPAAFAVDAAFGFALGGLTELMAADPVLGEALATEFLFEAMGAPDDQAIAFMFALPGFGPVDIPLAAAATRGRDAVIANRRAAASTAPSAAAATAAYVAAATAHTDDPQNAHDTGVLASLRAVVDRLRAEQAGPLATLDAVIADIRRDGAKFSEGRPHLVADAVAVAERTRRGERVLAIGATDEECLRRVWQRADDPRNAAKRAEIRQAVFDALADAWEPGSDGAPRHIVCVNGRTTRLLAALVLLDWDEQNWGVKSLEQFKNDAFARAARVIAETAAAAAAGADPELRAAAAAWRAATPAELAAANASDEASERLADLMRAAVGADVDTFAAESGISLPPPVIAAVRLEAQAAVA